MQPEPEACPVKEAADHPFRRSVLAPDASHHPATHCGRNDVSQRATNLSSIGADCRPRLVSGRPVDRCLANSRLGRLVLLFLPQQLFCQFENLHPALGLLLRRLPPPTIRSVSGKCIGDADLPICKSARTRFPTSGSGTRSARRLQDIAQCCSRPRATPSGRLRPS